MPPELLRGLWRARALRQFAGLSGSGLLYHVLYLGRGFAAARLLGPELLGYWTAGYILTLYLGCSHLGALSAMRREMNIAHGAGDRRRFDALARAGLTMAVVPSVALGLAVAAWVGLRWQSLPPNYRWIILLVAGLGVMQQVGIFYSFCLYARERFRPVSIAQTVTAVLLAATIPLIWWWGLPGLAAGFVVSQAAGIAVTARAAQVPFRFSTDRALLGSVIRLGIPFLGSILLFTLQGSIDRLVILAFYDERHVGLFSVALQALALLNVLLGSLGQVAYSRMGAVYGETGDPAALYARFRRWALLLPWAAAPILLAAYAVIPHAVRLLLPNYQEAIPAISIVCIQGFFLSLVVIPANILAAIRRNGTDLALQSLTVLLTWLFCVLSARHGLGLAGIAMANAAATAVYAALVTAAAAHRTGHSASTWLPTLARQGAPLLLGVAVVLAATWAGARPTPDRLAVAGLTAAAAALGAALAMRRSGVTAFLREMQAR